MAADVHVMQEWVRQLLELPVTGWRVLLPFSIVLLVCFVWFWLPKLLVGVLTRFSRRYVRSTSSGPTDFAVSSAGEHHAIETVTKANPTGQHGFKSAFVSAQLHISSVCVSSLALGLFMRPVLRLLLLSS